MDVIVSRLSAEVLIMGCLLASQVSTLDGVLEVRNEHFWTIGFGSLVCRHFSDH